MMREKAKVSIAVIIVAAFFSGIMFTTVGANIFGLGDRIGIESNAAGGTRLDGPVAGVADLEDAFTEVASRVNPTVVQIQSETLPQRRESRQPNGRNPFEGTPFEDFFGQFEMGPQVPMPRSGLGSGVIFRENGFIVTNNHVVEGADELTVVMFDGSEYSAEVVGTDPVSDVAVVRINKNNLPFISIGDSENLRVGQWVMAFGSPLSEQLSNTVTAGIISAIGRLQGGMTPGFTGEEPTGPSQIHNFIQTDAAINPGNSGGPLVNLRGELVGINTAIVTRTGGNQGIGFAIPVNTVKDVANELIETGRVERARLGVAYSPASESVIDALDLPRGAAVVSSVEEESAADKAGIQAGDIIVSINGTELTNHLQVSQIIGRLKPGDTATVVVNREGDEKSVRVRLGGWEGGEERPTASRGEARNGREQMMEDLGITLSNITPELARRSGYEGEIEGVIITDVEPSSKAFRDARLRAGTVIVEVDRERVRNVGEFENVYEDVEKGKSFLVKLQLPNGQTDITALTKP